jgi:hypothetical protein
MNNAQNRADLAAALTGVEGVTGYPRRPTAVKAGDAWPLWRGAERSDGFTFVQTFAVIVALPGEEAQADVNADAYGPLLADALEGLMFVESIAPATVDTSAGDMNALLITGRME